MRCWSVASVTLSSNEEFMVFRNKSPQNKTRNSRVLVLTRFRTGSFSHCLLHISVVLRVCVLMNNSWAETASFRSIKIQWRWKGHYIRKREAPWHQEYFWQIVALLLLSGSRKLLKLQNVRQVEDEFCFNWWKWAHYFLRCLTCSSKARQ